MPRRRYRRYRDGGGGGVVRLTSLAIAEPDAEQERGARRVGRGHHVAALAGVPYCPLNYRLADTDLAGSSFTECNLSQSNFSKAAFQFTVIEDSNFAGANLGTAILNNGAYIQGSDLSKIASLPDETSFFERAVLKN